MSNLKTRMRKLNKVANPEVTRIFYLNCLPGDKDNSFPRETVNGEDWLLVYTNEDKTYKVYIEPPERNIYTKDNYL
ncbi:MAG: hypothetical protein KGI13_02255 [Betaproteobacteria bacterium]|nr:hypothetical protein [Betaproteobacteria bacterium]